MSTIYGVLGIGDRSAVVDTVGQAAIWSTINQFAARQEAEVNLMSTVFVQGDTTEHSETYYLPSGGMLQSASNLTRPGAVKPVGSWSVGYPIEDGRDQVAINDVALAYMNGDQVDAYTTGVMTRYTNWRRFLQLRALLNKTNESITDPVRGAITVKRLANGDSDLYPPNISSSAEATENHYAGTNYASSDISDTNNPFKTLRTELGEHFGNGRVVAFINSAQRDKVEALTSFEDRAPMWVTLGSDTNVAVANGANVPGDFIGAAKDVAVFVWDWIPADYMFGLDLNQPAPLKRRLDSAASLQGFKLVAKQTEYPLEESFWRAREGYGVANRLNGVAYQFVASTTYTTPTLYA